MRCVKCNRKLKHEPPPEALGFGPSCFRSAFGSRTKPRRVKAQPKRDSLTPDMFPELDGWKESPFLIAA